MHSAAECPHSIAADSLGLKCASALNTVWALPGDI